MGLGLAALLTSLIGGAVAGGMGIGTGALQQQHQADLDAKASQIASQLGIPQSAARYLVNQYDKGAINLFSPKSWFNNGIDTANLRKDYEDYLKVKDSLGPIPTRPEDDKILAESNAAIDKENADINNLYDQMLGRSSNLFEKQMDYNNQAYNDYRNQVLTNNAQQMNMIQGGMRNELDRQQRTAITRGASAAQRLVANINAQMNTQNKAAQQALDTSNNIAQSLLAQRNAANSLRSDYTNMLNNDTNRRAELMRGTQERKTNYGNARLGQAYDVYNNKMDTWNDKLTSKLGNNPWAQVHRNEAIANSY